MGSTKQISPCSDWFYVGPADDIIFEVAAWALHDNGEVVGLISAGATNDNNIARLVTPPPVGGTYVHLSALTGDQKFKLSMRSIS